MSFLAMLGTLLLALNAGTEIPASRLWTDLKAKREGLSRIHQEFEVSRTFTKVSGSQSSKWKIILDMSQGQWRETSVSGSGNHITIFDGENRFLLEEGSDEFVRTKRHSKEEDQLPLPYGLTDPDWSKAAELERRPCGIPGSDHQCVILEVTLKPSMRGSSGTNVSRMLEGSERILLDVETGLVLSLRTAQVMETREIRYRSDLSYALKRMSYGGPADASLFKLPSNNMREVKELSPWNATKIKKQLAGEPAPPLELTDMQGKPVTLSAFKGKTVLLDFWTTWCSPCRADAPALDKLYRKYGGQNLMIVGISVSEERAIVEKFLQEHPHSFPIALTTENEIPRPYQIGVFPTYIVIDRDGTVATAVEGDKGFGELRSLLKKAGLELE